LIYVCIPAHDEAPTIGVLLWKIRKVMADFGRDYKVLVLDDASTDGTSDTLVRYRKVLPLTVVHHDERLGYGKALERLIREAVAEAPYPKRDAVVTLQGDFTEDPADIVTLVKALEGGADVVAGVVGGEDRTLPGAVRWARRLAPLVLGRGHSGAPVSDPLSGYRAYRVIVLKKMLREAGEGPLLRQEGWAANLELLGLVAPHARRIEEAPLEMRYHLQTRESRFRALRVLRDLLRFRGTALWASGSGKTA